MTENTSPENLRKFLESDDPAMVQMGLSMAKGTEVPEKLLPNILRLYMWDDDKTVRAAAKSVFNKWAPDEIQLKVKENWKPNYRTLNKVGDKFSEAIRSFIEVFKSQEYFILIALEPLIKALEGLCLGGANGNVRRDATVVLGKIGNKRAVELLIKALEDDNGVREVAAYWLGNIGDKRAIEPLIKALEDESCFCFDSSLGACHSCRVVRRSAVNALENIGGKRAIETLIKALEDKDSSVRRSAAKALGNIGDKRATEPLTNILQNYFLGSSHRIRSVDEKLEIVVVAEALGNIGDKRATELLIKGVDFRDEPWAGKSNNLNLRSNSSIALVKITRANIKGKKQDNIIKFLESDDPAMVRMGAAMLKGILEK